MKKLFALLFSILLAVVPASAQFFNPPQFFAKSYAGPGDVVPGASAWWGLRCYSNNYAGNVADVWDAATGSTTETLITCSLGGFLHETINPLATTCASGCRIKTLYDQTGGSNCGGTCNQTQATNATRPTLTLNCKGTLYCASFTGTQFLQAPNNVSGSIPISYSWVGDTTNSSATNDIAGGAGFLQTGFAAGPTPLAGGPNTAFFYAGNPGVNAVSVGAADNVFHAANISQLTIGPTSILNIDGVENSRLVGSNTGMLAIGVFPAPNTNFLIGNFMEMGVWPVAFSQAQRYAQCHFQDLYYTLGIGTNCSVVPGLINNFQGLNSQGYTSQVTHRDQFGNAVEINAGDLIQVGSKYYAYGEAHSCGNLPGTAGSPYCGVKVYSTTDLQHWTYEGLLFDPNGSTWQSDCVGTTGPGNLAYCYEPVVIYNALTNKYVVWIYGETATPTTTSNFYILTCATPTGGATPTIPGTGCTRLANATFSSGGAEAPALGIDGSGNGYVVWTDLGSTPQGKINVTALNPAFTNTIGPDTYTGQQGEGLGTFQYLGRTYIVYGSIGCGYCISASLSIMSAATPLAAYGSPIQVNGGSCGGQPMGVAIKVNNTVIVATDQWWAQHGGGNVNQGFANVYWMPLVFSGTNPIALDCQNTVDAVLPPSGNVVIPPGPGPIDQSDYADAFADLCDISTTLSRMQQFVPSKSTVTAVALPLGKNNGACGFFSPCPQPDGSITVSLVTLDGSGNPATTLASQSIPAANIQWATQWTTITFNQAVTPGTKYGIMLTSNTVSQKCYGSSYSDSNLPNVPQPYAAGLEKVNTGSGWTAEPGRSLLFITY